MFGGPYQESSENMNFDVDSHLGAVERSVSWLKRDGQPASGVTLARSFATTVEDLWDAVTNGERIPRWFAPVSGDLRLGGRYQIEGNAGGEITACEQNSHFALDWEFGGWMSWVEVSVSDEGSGQGAAQPHAHRAPLGILGHLRPGGGRGRLGDGFPGARPVSRATRLAKA